MRAISLSVVLFIAVAAQAAFEFVPPAPTDQTFVFLEARAEVWRDGCTPTNPTVTRHGNTIDVTWTPRGGGCPLVVSEWSSRAPIGVLEPGVYDVQIRIAGTGFGTGLVATKKLVVDDADPAFVVEPRVVRATAPGLARIDLCRYAPEGPLPQPVVVTVGGTVVPAQVSFCSVDVSLPPHAPGPVDVRVRIGNSEHEVVNALRYIDPAADPDPALFERVLVPVLFNGPGAFGSQWETEVEMINASSRPIVLLPEADRPLESLAANASVSLAAFGNRPAGLVLFLPRGFDVRFGSIIRDTSREAGDLGTEVRVVREDDFRSELSLPNVPFDSRYRVQLRVYELDGIPTDVVIYARQDGVTKGLTQVIPTGDRPAFAAVDLTSELALLVGKGRHDLTIVANEDGLRRLWALVTVTNNVTQHVTVISPQ